MTKTKLVLSGPGSGKTTKMIDEVVEKLPILKPNCYMTVVTYTNVATEDIRLKLSKRILIPPNLFIGTIHSFLNKFLVIPYAPLFGICPNEICFIDEILVDDPKYKNFITKKAREKGVISYDQIEWIAEKILYGGTVKRDTSSIKITKKMSKSVIEAISRRLQIIFVDEYQDATVTQHKIFKQIISGGNTEYFYCVGDCEQYIYGFTYNKKRIKKPKFIEIPIKEFEKDKNTITEDRKENYRSSPIIVEFLNKFSSIKQVAYTSFSQEIPVFHIKETEINKIIKIFQKLCENYGLSDQKKFYLAHFGETFSSMELSGVSKITNNVLRYDQVLSGILRYLSGILGISQKKLREIKAIDQIELRKIGCRILKIIKRQPDISQNEIDNIIAGIFRMKISKQYNNKDMLERVKNSHNDNKHNGINHFTTIHKAKGLEANAVLVIAEASGKLEKWLEINKSLRECDTTDQCRIGFVAFSRAKQLLCLACCKDTSSLVKKLNELGVEIIE